MAETHPLVMRPSCGLPDHIKPGVRVLFVGINPGLRSAAIGHHFAGHSNRFWKLLYESRLLSEPLTAEQDWRLPEWGLGLTNIIRRPTAGIDSLDPHEYRTGKRRLSATIRRYRPKLVALLGVTIYRLVCADAESRPVRLGLQETQLAGAPLFVLPNPSGRNAHYSHRTMLRAFQSLRQLSQ